MPNKFRIYAKKLLLTYSQVCPEITPQHILEQLREKLKFSNFSYLIGKEKHQDGGIHYHVLLSHFEKLQIRNPKDLDIQYQGNIFHGNYTPVNHLRQAVLYACKGKDYITNLESLHQGHLLTAKEFIVKEVNEKGIEQALMDYYARTPDKAITGLSVTALKRHFMEVEKLKLALQMDKIETPFGLKSFRVTPDLQQWIRNPNRTLFLVGDSGIGKTQFCKALVKHKQLKTLFVSHKEDFKRLNGSYDAIIVDDANIHELEETQLLSVIDNQADKTIRVLYDAVVKKAHMVQIIAMNNNEFRKLAYTLQQQRFARRILLHKPENPFIVNVNINVNQVNNVNNVGNITNTFNISEMANNTHHHNDFFQQHQEDERIHIQNTIQKIKEIARQTD